MDTYPSDHPSRPGARNRHQTTASRQFQDQSLHLTVPMRRDASSSSNWSLSSGASSAYSYYEAPLQSTFPSFPWSHIEGDENDYPFTIASQQLSTSEPSSPSLRGNPRHSESDSRDVGAVGEENLPPFDPRLGDPRIHWTMYYDYRVNEHEAYWTIQKGYLISTEFPRRRPDEKAFDSKGKRCFPCRHRGCKTEPFGRCWDLKRHYKIHCSSKEKEKIPCDYRVCPASRNKNPFDRRDHCREHYRAVHKEDLIKRNMDENVEEWLVDRQTSPSWWRCSKCLHRKKVRKYGYNCDECNVPCEHKRVIARQQKIEKARLEEQQSQTVVDRYSASSTATPRTPSQYFVSRSAVQHQGSDLTSSFDERGSVSFGDGDEDDSYNSFAFADDLTDNVDFEEPMTGNYAWAQHSVSDRGNGGSWN